MIIQAGCMKLRALGHTPRLNCVPSVNNCQLAQQETIRPEIPSKIMWLKEAELNTISVRNRQITPNNTL